MFRSSSHGRATATGVAFALCVGTAAAQPTVRVELVHSGLSRPTCYTQDPSDPSLQYVCEQFQADIHVIQDGQVIATPFLDLTGKVSTNSNERGLFSIAFPPDYGDTGVFYVNYTNLQGETHVSRFNRDADNPLLADPDSEEVILFVDQPFANHNGGDLKFGPDGYLYIGFGDGGSAGDPGHRAQNIGTLLGKMVRIDVDTETGYAIPADNPFVDNDPVNALEEIWAFGMRNPWQFCFDDGPGGTGAMVVGDVGQDVREEINYEPAGAGGRNYGWRNREGFNSFNNSIGPAYTPLTDPIDDYSHGIGRSVTGGVVYRGTKLGSEYQGRYFYADYVTRRIWSMGIDVDEETGEGTMSDLKEHTSDFGGVNVVGNVSSFGVDADGEIYFTNFTGRVYRIVPDDNTDLSDWEVTKGEHLSGNLASLRDSDDDRMRILSVRGFTAFEPNITELIVGATTAVSTPLQLDLSIESRIDQPFGTGKISLFNFTTGEYDQLETYAINFNEVLHFIEAVDNPGDYVSVDGRVQIRTKHVVIATLTVQGFKSRYDVVWADVY